MGQRGPVRADAPAVVRVEVALRGRVAAVGAALGLVPVLRVRGREGDRLQARPGFGTDVPLDEGYIFVVATGSLEVAPVGVGESVGAARSPFVF